ncbi:hypothetical protein R3P38DRAFT_3229750 [Favolaschia claudopus]|uniref:Uncharacterized protein n=1 Tax=Favolaschia claudopus TaxID=2862362 RepID=A0AAV9ZNX1_9AGAR
MTLVLRSSCPTHLFHYHASTTSSRAPLELKEMGKHRRQLFDDHLQQLRQRGDAEPTSTPRARRSAALILFHCPRQFLRLRLVGHRPSHASPSPTTHGLASIALSSLPSRCPRFHRGVPNSVNPTSLPHPHIDSHSRLHRRW